jgi:hypothetical protein
MGAGSWNCFNPPLVPGGSYPAVGVQIHARRMYGICFGTNSAPGCGMLVGRPRIVHTSEECPKRRVPLLGPSHFCGRHSGLEYVSRLTGELT